MLNYEFAHFAHVIAFAYLLAAELPVYFAARIALDANQNGAARIVAARIAKWTGTITSTALITLLPLGVVLGVSLGAYDLSNANWLVATWIVTASWLALLAAAEFVSGVWGRRLFIGETIVRFLIGLGNVYDGIVGLMGAGQTRADWLALKITIYGLVLLVSSGVRWRTRPARYAIAETVDGAAPSSQTANAAASLKAVGPAVLLTTLLVAVAAWMGINKSL